MTQISIKDNTDMTLPSSCGKCLELKIKTSTQFTIASKTQRKIRLAYEVGNHLQFNLQTVKMILLFKSVPIVSATCFT